MPAPTPVGRLHAPPFVAFAGGGTGGHLCPGLAVAEALQAQIPGVRVVFFCTHRPIDEEILGDTAYESIRQTLPVLSMRPWRWPQTILQYRGATKLCRSRLMLDRPNVVVGTGGLGSVAGVREARRLGIPTAIINPDVIPGRANRYLASQADIVFTQWPEASAHLPPGVHLVTTGCPIRAGFGGATREQGIGRFGLDGERKTLVVTGASQGAHTINQAVVANLAFLESRPEWQVLHLSGQTDLEAVRQSYAEHDIAATVLPFTRHMPEAMAIADLIVTRGGASSLAEATAAGVPAIILPYPFHRDRHQQRNAECVVRAGAGTLVLDRVDPALNGPALRSALEPLMGDAAMRQTMSRHARRIGHPDASVAVARHLVGLIEKGVGWRNRETMEAVV